MTYEYKEQITPIADRVIGTAANDITRTSTPAGGSALGDLMADAQSTFAGVDFAFMNPGGIQAVIAAGPVTYGEMFAVQPFDNGLVTMQLTGEQIYALLEQQFQAGGTRICSSAASSTPTKSFRFHFRALLTEGGNRRG